jgi:8-oxo-dGTP pyrophosphatase MutT (NUDIX family)
MSKFTKDWNSTEMVNATDQALPVRQVYTWYLTNDGKFLLVSKDGENWQLPGGKPDAGESLVQTAVREMQEETGVWINLNEEEPRFFGYYRVTTEANGSMKDTFLQVRFYVKATASASQLELTAENEDRQQANHDQIMHVKAVTTEEAKNLISWLASSGEFKVLEAKGLI